MLFVILHCSENLITNHFVSEKLFYDYPMDMEHVDAYSLVPLIIYTKSSTVAFFTFY